jgi:hypothetical protein
MSVTPPTSDLPVSDEPGELAERDAALAEDAARRFPGFTGRAVLHRSSTSVLISGDAWGEPAVAKLLVSSSPFWRDTIAREIDMYRTFAAYPPPFRVPRLIDADERLPGLLLELVDGERLSESRYPDEEIPPRRLAAVFTAQQRLAGWQAPLAALPQMLDYRARLDRYRRGGQLGETEHDQLTSLLRTAGSPTEFCHGDLVPRHILRRLDSYKEGDYAFVDWAFAGAFLPGFDLAKLWAVLRATFGARSEIEESVRGRGERAWHAFLANLSIVVLQEQRSHREAAADPVRLAALEGDWERVRDWLAAA